MTTPSSLPVAAIKVGDRRRKDMGDIAALAASIEKSNLLQPIGVRPDGQLVHGGRRLEAVKLLGWETVPVRFLEGLEDWLAYLEAERAENAFHKPLTPSEQVGEKRDMEGELKAQAKERIKEGAKAGGKTAGRGRPKQQPPGHCPGGNGRAGETRERIAAALGTSARVLSKAQAVVEAAEKDPEQFEALRKQMDDSGKVEGAYRKLQAATAAPPPAREPRRYPNSAQFEAWLHRLSDYGIYVEEERGGIANILAERDLWDWQWMDTYLVPLLEMTVKRLRTYLKEMRRATKQE
jgi:ParB family chromosome partitioning protein